MNAHAILSPSSAYRWLACTPSARFEEQYANEESVYAREGTIAHELAALILSARAGLFGGTQQNLNASISKIEWEAREFYEKQGKPSEFTSMLEHAEDYAKFVLEQAINSEIIIGGDDYVVNYDAAALKILVENKYDVFKFVPLGFGTSDCSALTKKILYVTDYKYGAGIRVSAVDNDQMKLYGLGALTKAKTEGWKDIETVVMSIYQPRAGGSSSWQISAEELIEWGEEVVKPAAIKAIAGVGEFVAGKHCQFCNAKMNCKAFYDRFADLKKLMDKRVMSNEDTAEVLAYGSLVSAWVKKVEEAALEKLQKGVKIPGFKLVTGNGRRTFKNEDEVVDILLGEGFESYDIFTPSLRSLTDLEKQLGKTKFNQLLGSEVIKTEGKPNIASEDDDRPAVGKSGADEYD